MLEAGSPKPVFTGRVGFLLRLKRRIHFLAFSDFKAHPCNLCSRGVLPWLPFYEDPVARAHLRNPEFISHLSIPSHIGEVHFALPGNISWWGIRNVDLSGGGEGLSRLPPCRVCPYIVSRLHPRSGLGARTHKAEIETFAEIKSEAQPTEPPERPLSAYF